MMSSSLHTMLKLSKTSSPQKLFDYNCVTLYLNLAKNILLKKVLGAKYFLKMAIKKFKTVPMKRNLYGGNWKLEKVLQNVYCCMC